MRGDENSEHMTITTHEGCVHVVSVALIEDLIEGRRKLSDMPDMEDVMRAILDEWLTDRRMRG